MAAKKTIAIAGATGKTGIVIANKLANADYRLLLISKDEPRLTEILIDIKRKAPEAEADISNCEKEGCWEADIIILADPFYAAKEVAEKIKEVATQKIVVSVLNLDTLFVQPPIEELQVLLPHSQVVKVFHISKTGQTLISGDDEDAVQTISNMVESAGFNSILISDLSENRTLEISNF